MLCENCAEREAMDLNSICEVCQKLYEAEALDSALIKKRNGDVIIDLKLVPKRLKSARNGLPPNARLIRSFTLSNSIIQELERQKEAGNISNWSKYIESLIRRDLGL